MRIPAGRVRVVAKYVNEIEPTGITNFDDSIGGNPRNAKAFDRVPTHLQLGDRRLTPRITDAKTAAGVGNFPDWVILKRLIATYMMLFAVGQSLGASGSDEPL